MFDIITIGSATRDVFIKSASLDVHESDNPAYPSEGCFPMGAKIDIDELVFQTGGGATNAAATLARLGFKVGTVSSIGDDTNGRDVMNELKELGVSRSLLQKDPDHQTAYSIIVVAGSGERTVLVHRGAARKLDTEKIPWKKMKAKWLYLTSLGGDLEGAERIIDHANKHRIKVMWNPGNSEIKAGLDRLEPMISKVEIFDLNREEASTLTGIPADNLQEIISRLRIIPKCMLLVTDGLGGTYSIHGDQLLHCGIMDVPRINTTGAGDAFGSGFIAGILKTGEVEYALSLGTWNASGVVQEMGAKRGLLSDFPTDEEIGAIEIKPWK
jgi:ribokinase